MRSRKRYDQIEEIGRLWDEGIASGPSVDGPRAMKDLKAKFAIRDKKQAAE